MNHSVNNMSHAKEVWYIKLKKKIAHLFVLVNQQISPVSTTL